jgi:adenylate cyclase
MAMPAEDHRIFLFIDLNDSTMLAERLGHIKYSMFLSAFFNDFERCRKHIGGEVYQFVGDEVITTWKFSEVNVGKSIALAALFEKELHKKRSWYRREFGYCPDFKGAIHQGKVAITKIGNQKTYHGDVLNTCSRLLDVASKLKLGIVASEHIVGYLPGTTFEKLNDTSIRGKEHQVKIFSITTK